MDFSEKKLSEKIVFQGSFLTIRKDAVGLPSGAEASREWVVHPGAVTILAVTDENKIVMVKQYRYPIESHTWELPAGKLSTNEDPMECAKRELQEETGYLAQDWKLLYTFFTTPGFSNEIMYLYLARGLQKGLPSPDEDEFVHGQEFSRDEIKNMIEKQEINDAKTLIGVMWEIE